MEKLTRLRLTHAIVSAGYLSPQHCFRSGQYNRHHPEDSASSSEGGGPQLLVTPRGRPHHTFHVPIYLLRIIESYLTDSTLLYNTTEGQRLAFIASAAVQGSNSC
ncbi:hypothetical protein J6590_003263 [Homalodisca vitripennis]|nr:hypothetical protein J6590_003263 [Homalodisca vitripennis]